MRRRAVTQMYLDNEILSLTARPSLTPPGALRPESRIRSEGPVFGSFLSLQQISEGKH